MRQNAATSLSVSRANAVAALIALVAAASVAAQGGLPTSPPPQVQRPPVFRGGANLVLVDVYPTIDGKIAEGLQPSDFQVFENGARQSVDQFEFIRVEPSPAEARRDPNSTSQMLREVADPHNRVFVIFLDHFHTNVSGSHSTRRPLVDLLERILGPTDLFAVTTVNRRPRDLVFGRQTLTLETQLADNWAWGLRHSLTLEPDEQRLAGCVAPDIPGLAEVIAKRMREDKALTHLEGLIGHLGTLREGRKSILVFTSGWLLYPPDEATVQRVVGNRPAGLPGIGVVGGGLTVGARPGDHDRTVCTTEFARLFTLDGPQRMRDIIRNANRNNVTFYPINPSGMEVFDEAPHEVGRVPLTTSLDRLTARADAMRTLSDNTDGLTIISNDLAGGLRRIVDDVSAYYVIGYSSTNGKADGTYRRIEVKIDRPKVRVRARRGYVAPVEAPVRAIGAAATASAVPTGLTEALGVLSRLRRDAEFYAHAAVMDNHAAVAVELPASQVMAGGRFSKGAEVTVRMTGDGIATTTVNGRIEAGQRSTLVRLPFTASPVTVPVRIDVNITAPAPLTVHLDAAPQPSGLLGDVIVFRGLPAPTAPLRAVADFHYRRTERARLEWPIRATLAQRTARLLNRLGQPLPVPITLTEYQADGRTLLAADLLLAPLAEGDYVVELSVGSAATPEQRYVAIRVTR
jgi:VWFA-related protein